jgi:hypothetical protein
MCVEEWDDGSDAPKATQMRSLSKADAAAPKPEVMYASPTELNSDL